MEWATIKGGGAHEMGDGRVLIGRSGEERRGEDIGDVQYSNEKPEETARMI
jgi:hypothetical protein